MGRRSLAQGGAARTAGQQRDAGRGDGAAVRDRDLREADLEGSRALERPPVEREARLAAFVAADLDLAKREPAPAEAQRLHRRLLGREAARDVLGERARVAALPPDLARAEDAS